MDAVLDRIFGVQKISDIVHHQQMLADEAEKIREEISSTENGVDPSPMHKALLREYKRCEELEQEIALLKLLKFYSTST